jgi:hypothetical protein
VRFVVEAEYRRGEKKHASAKAGGRSLAWDDAVAVFLTAERPSGG